jgi:tRNA/tmRNA/rRNA uracil-C5-methylase (TrmA/RlmC/RlmD family)
LIDESHEGAIHMQVATIGLDLAKHVFQIHGIDAAEQSVLAIKASR